MSDQGTRPEATPRYVPGRPQRAASPQVGSDDTPDQATGAAVGAGAETALAVARRMLPESAEGEPAATGGERPRSGVSGRYLIGLVAFTLAGALVIAWLVWGYAEGRVSWPMLVPFVPFVLVMVAVWVLAVRGRR